MPWVQFLVNHNVDHFHHKSGDTADLRDAHAESLVRQNIATYVDDPNDEVGLASTDINTFAKLDAIVADKKLIFVESDWTGTEGSVVFVGSNGGLDEDNDNFFWDDTADELGIGNKTPAARLHVSRDLSTGDGIRMSHSAEDSTAWAIYSGTGGATADFGVTGDGRVAIGETEPNTNATLRVVTADGATGVSATLIVNNEDVTTDTYAVAQFTQSASGQDAVDITANNIDTATALDVQANGLTTGEIASFTSSSASAGSRDLVEIINDNTSAVNATPLMCRNDAAGTIAAFRSGTGVDDVEFAVLTTGHLVMQPTPTTDVAPADDTSSKQWSIQRLAADPTNGAFLKFSNSPGTPTNDFYIVLEEKT